MERKSRKIYYTMGEVSEMFDVNPSLIRFWEQKFDILKPDKNKKGNRLFSPRDVENLKLIYHLVKENGMTLAGAAKRLRENREGVEHNLEIIERLQRMRAMLMEVREELKSGDDREVFVDTDVPEDTYVSVPREDVASDVSDVRTKASVAIRSSAGCFSGSEVVAPANPVLPSATGETVSETKDVIAGGPEPVCPVATDEGREAGPPVPPFIQREIPVPPQPVLPAPFVSPAGNLEAPPVEPKAVQRPSIVEQTLF